MLYEVITVEGIILQNVGDSQQRCRAAGVIVGAGRGVAAGRRGIVVAADQHDLVGVPDAVDRRDHGFAEANVELFGPHRVDAEP